MNTVPSGTTHSRYNKQKRKTNYFIQSPEGDCQIWNQKWEPYSGSTSGLIPVEVESSLTNKKKSAKTSEKPKRKPPVKTQEVKFDNVIPTLAEEVADLVPTPVLRKLLEHYKNADVVEVVIHVKTTHIIQG